MTDYPHRCVSCQFFKRIFYRLRCELSDRIIHYPFKHGRFCDDYKQRQMKKKEGGQR